MRRLALLLCLLLPAPLWGQIDLAPEQSLGKRIIATSASEAKAYAWHCDSADVLAEGGRCYIWARPGQHTLTLITVAEDYTISRYEQPFAVTLDPTPPTPATLRELVTETEARQIADYLRALAGQVTQIRDAAQFWAVWQQTFPVKGNTRLDAALKSRLTPALEAKKGLSTALLTLANEFAEPLPDPQPLPDNVAPIPEPGLNILIVEETADRLKLPEGQRDIITGTEWRTRWMAKGGEVRMRDPSDTHPNDAAKWNRAMERPRAGLPWVIISNGTTGYEGPLPASLAEWDALLARYGG